MSMCDGTVSGTGSGRTTTTPIPHAPDRFGLRDADAERPFSDAAFGPALARAQALVPALRGRRIGRRLNGVYALTPDALPLAGPLPGLPRVWVAEGCWVTQAGGLGAQLARQLGGEGEPLVDPARLDPGRFEGWDVDRVRTAALRHYRGV
ncbi:FAD-dependent oxidoreductase [Streptomyces sp. SID11385]|uniref:FAD-dependent oxidoreductase n=1 Tax=Streptomyces sp. SID11385 TaxID=2706031 RepID=UPI001EF2A2DC|nr:FAD-dependent oxidoreductase [Streptomyces sp. SID11385]